MGPINIARMRYYVAFFARTKLARVRVRCSTLRCVAMRCNDGLVTCNPSPLSPLGSGAGTRTHAALCDDGDACGDGNCSTQNLADATNKPLHRHAQRAAGQAAFIIHQPDIRKQRTMVAGVVRPLFVSLFS